MSTFYTAVARFYDAETGEKTDDLALFSRLAHAHPGEILDVGCGTGRVLIHLANEGHTIHGIENDPAMLERLEQKVQRQPHLRGRISYVRADAQTHSFDSQFSLILLSYNALMHFKSQAAQVSLLENLRACLAADGALVIDLPNAAPAYADENSDALTWERNFLDPASGHLVMLQSISWLDRAAQLLNVDWIYDEIDGDGVVRRLIASHELRYFFLAELRLLLDRCRFQVEAVHGDHAGGKYDDESERMIVIATGKDPHD